MARIFDWRKFRLPTMEDFEKIAQKHSEVESGIVRWTEEYVFFCYELPEYRIKPEISFSTLVARAKGKFPKKQLKDIHVLIGVDLENGSIRYEFFADGFEPIFIPRKFYERQEAAKLPN